MEVFLTPLEHDANSVLADIRRFTPYLNKFQIDIADGQFVSNTTAHPKDYISQLVSTNGERYDFHLMVINPAAYLEYIAPLSNVITIGTVLIHTAIRPNIDKLTALYPHLSFGLVINHNENVEEISKMYNLSQFPIIQVMTVENGHQGNPFIPESLNKVEQLRELHYRNKIAIDGGVSDITIRDVCKAPSKPDILAVGSYLIRAKDEEIEGNIHLLEHSC